MKTSSGWSEWRTTAAPQRLQGIADANDATMDGITYYAGADMANTPAQYATINTIRQSNNYFYQIASQINTTNPKMWARSNNQAGDFGNWAEVPLVPTSNTLTVVAGHTTATRNVCQKYGRLVIISLLINVTDAFTASENKVIAKTPYPPLAEVNIGMTVKSPQGQGYEAFIRTNGEIVASLQANQSSVLLRISGCYISAS